MVKDIYPKEKIAILFVCLGNICRSPAAEGAFNKILEIHDLEDKFVVDSAGTAGYHIGELPHTTTRKVAASNGIMLNHKARQFQKQDFVTFDYILAMDESNYTNILSLAEHNTHKEKVHLFRKFDPEAQGIQNVPDPYYGELNGFKDVHEIVTRASEGFFKFVLNR